MSSTIFSLFNTFPVELVLNVLDHISDCKTLLKCRQVCHLFRDLVDHTATLQYTINLAVAAQEPCCANSASPAVLLDALKQHQNAWEELKWSRELHVPMLMGGLWELCGGVLAQSDEQGALTFFRLPSDLRSIKEKEWSLSFTFPVRDFGMDPSQDLLLLIESPRWVGQNADHTYRLHLRTLTTGESHHQAKGGAILSHIQGVRDTDTSYTIQISGHYVGVLFNSAYAGESELVIWDWKTSQIQMHLVGDQIRCFSFLSHAYVVICLLREFNEDEEYGPVLSVVDFQKESERCQSVSDVQHAFCFHYPPLHEDVDPFDFDIRSDPAPLWGPHHDPCVPFHIDKNSTLYVISLWVEVQGDVRCVITFVPSTTLLACINSINARDIEVDFDWGTWGPHGTRMLVPAQPHSNVWVCYVYGSKYVISETGENGGSSSPPIRIYDFNQLALKRSLSTEPYTQTASFAKPFRHDVLPVQHTQYHISPTLLEGGEIFEEDVQTFLPYRSRTLPLTLPLSYECAALCSEDNIIISDPHLERREYIILTF